MIRRVLPKLPLRWPERGNLLAMIYPNPLNPKRYVVLNSGHTFHEAELKGTNALLFPRLGDYAIIRESDGAVIKAGLFDSHWK